MDTNYPYKTEDICIELATICRRVVKLCPMLALKKDFNMEKCPIQSNAFCCNASHIDWLKFCEDKENLKLVRETFADNPLMRAMRGHGKRIFS